MALEVGSAVFRIAVPSLVKLLKYEWGLDNKVKMGLTGLEGDLRAMEAFLENVSGIQPDQLDLLVKLQADQVRELWYAIENRLHSFMVRIESAKGTLLSAASKLKINHEIAGYIKEVDTKVKEVRVRFGAYPLKSTLESTSTREVDLRMFAMYTGESNPVGITGAIDELTKKLSEGDHVSIVGMGGMGKTTLAQAVYDKMKSDFTCSAFVPIGQRADTKKVLMYTFEELGIDNHGHEPEGQLTNQLRKFLKDKRCLIVIDDIWDEGIWNFAESVFKGGAGSKIITTTRNHKVAEDVGGVYQIKPLSLDNSKKLFHTKARAKNNDTEFEKLSDKILRKCGGIPIAITMIGSLLAKNQSREWNRVYDSIGFDEHKEDGAFEHIRMVFHYSYRVLPLNIKKCFLYLNLFPEDHWIEKNMLIWRWIGEGLVPGFNEQTPGLFEIGEAYFNELLDRSMVQWAVSPRDLGQGGCRVHSLMLDLIRDLSSSKKENFSIVLGMKQESTSQTSPIHRLAIHKTNVGQIRNTSLEVGAVLSLYANTCPGSSMPQLSKFARLRVIDLEGCDLSLGDCKLKHLGKLNELAYIGLLGTPVTELPDNMGGLKFLQILDVTATGIKELPSFVEKLRKLRCLRASKGTRMMGQVGKLTSLEELWLHSVDKSPDFTAELKKLTELRVLVIHFDKMDESLKQVLVESLSSMKKLQVLQVWSDEEEMIHLGDWEGNIPSPHLRQLLLFRVSLPSLASWINCSYVPKLSKLLLHVETLEAQHLEILGQMPSLRSLYLHSVEYNRLSYTANKDEFKVLEYLNTNIELVCGDGALPAIKELEVGGVMVGTDVGLQGNMPLLERASYHLDCIGCLLEEIEKAEAVLMQATQAHPNHPTLAIKRFNNYKIELEQQHRFIESAAPEFVRTVALLLSDPGSIPGLGGGGEVQVDAFVKMADSIARFRSTVGEPPILTMGDATDGTGSTSQSAGGVPPRGTNGEGQVLLTTSSRFQSAKHKAQFSTDELLANLKGQSAAKVASTLATLAGTKPEVVMGMQKWSRSPEMIASMNSMEWDGTGSMSASNISVLLQLMMPEMISKLGGAGRGSGTSAHYSATPTQEVNDGVDSLIADDAMSARIGSLLGDDAVTGTTATDAFADVRESLTKSLQNTEVVASLKSLRNTGGSEPSASDVSKLGKLMIPDLMSTMDKQTDGPGRGQDAEANLPWKHPAGNSGASVSRELPPNVPSMQTQVDGVFSRLNSPDGADFVSKLVDQFSRNPNMIASMVPNGNILDMVPNGNILDMVPVLLSNPAFCNILNLVAQPSVMDVIASNNATVTQGFAAATESNQDGENLTRMFNLKELLPTLEQALDADQSSGQPSSTQGNAGAEEGSGGK